MNPAPSRPSAYYDPFTRSSDIATAGSHGLSRNANRDSTPPVGAIMDIQMMHASHLFNEMASQDSRRPQAPAMVAPEAPMGVPKLIQNDTSAYDTSQVLLGNTEFMKRLCDDSFATPVKQPTDASNTLFVCHQPTIQESVEQSDATEGEDMTEAISDTEAERQEVDGMNGMTEDEEDCEDPDEDGGSEHGDKAQANERDSKQEEAEVDEDAEVEGDEEEYPSEYSDDEDEEDITNATDDDDDVIVYGSDDEAMSTDERVVAEIDNILHVFQGIENHFKFLDKIGEGTFSSVYKAMDLNYHQYNNSWDTESIYMQKKDGVGGTHLVRKPKYVAIKKIYVTSSPARIQNELELLHDLTGCDSVVPLITAFRHEDQVMAILPYCKHTDFRDFFRKFSIEEMRYYCRSLFTALSHVHSHHIIHRDIKPTNFLYDVTTRRGMLVDFGLAEREVLDAPLCTCQSMKWEPKLPSKTEPAGYPKDDPRPSKRANRAGTRGFRAPEVLFKCTSQTCSIDVWSAGVILLTMLARRFPFFNSADDVDATIEIATIFGRSRMRRCAALHGCHFDTTLPTIGEKGFTLEKIILWSTGRTAASKTTEPMGEEEKVAVDFLEQCFDLDPVSRITAKAALQHPFLAVGTPDEV